jgi:hypothetical protein
MGPTRRQRTSEVGQRDRGSSSSVARRVSGRIAGPSPYALHQSQLRRNCHAADFRLVQHELLSRSKDPTLEKVVL